VYFSGLKFSTFDRVIELLKVLTWAHTGPVLILLILVIFRRAFNELLGRVQRIAKTEKGFGVDFEKSPVPLASSTTAEAAVAEEITVEDVRTEFKKIPKLTPEDVDRYAPDAQVWLLRNGVRHKSVLHAFVAAKLIFEKVEEIYVEELKRPKEAPYDPVAIATWGATLFVCGLTDHNLEAVRRLVRLSPEYEQKRRKIGGFT
jgi:hypothetical protein